MDSYADQVNARGNMQPPTSYPFSERAYPEGKPPAYVAPPPMGYPVNNSVMSYSDRAPVQTTNRGDGFWRGCCAALCCCCLLDMCF